MRIDASRRSLIEDFLNDYAHAIDDGELNSWPEFFTEDGLYQIITRESFDAGLQMGILLCEGRGMMSDRIVAMETANIFEPHTYCHILGRTQLTLSAGGEIAGRTNFQVIRTLQDGTTDIFVVGKYLDKITLDGGKPLLAMRRVILESRRIDILLVYPL